MADDEPPPLSSLPPTTIRYTVTRGDLVIGNFRAIFFNRLLMGLWAILIAGICFSMVRDPQVAGHGLVYKSFFVLFAAGFYLALFVVLTSLVTAAMVLLRKNRGILGEHRITLTPDGLVESTAFNESLHRWAAYHRTVATNRHLFLFATEGTAHMVPRKRPLLEGNLAEFEAALRHYTGGR